MGEEREVEGSIFLHLPSDAVLSLGAAELQACRSIGETLDLKDSRLSLTFDDAALPVGARRAPALALAFAESSTQTQPAQHDGLKTNTARRDARRPLPTGR